MGAWGVTARESDTGLDYLKIVEERHLKRTNYKYFIVSTVTKLLKDFIIDGIKRENKGCSAEDMEFYIEVNFPYSYGHAVMLISECLNEYFENNKLVIHLYNSKENQPPALKIVKEFAYSEEDLRYLLDELQKLLDPTHDLYQAWRDSKRFDEWQAYIKKLQEGLESRIHRIE